MLLDGRLGHLDGILQLLGGVLGLVELRLTVELLLVVASLLGLQVGHHLINHFDDLAEANALALQGHEHEVDLLAALGGVAEQGRGTGAATVADSWTCTKLAALPGSVFLNNSNA